MKRQPQNSVRVGFTRDLPAQTRHTFSLADQNTHYAQLQYTSSGTMVFGKSRKEVLSKLFRSANRDFEDAHKAKVQVLVLMKNRYRKEVK